MKRGPFLALGCAALTWVTGCGSALVDGKNPGTAASMSELGGTTSSQGGTGSGGTGATGSNGTSGPPPVVSSSIYACNTFGAPVTIGSNAAAQTSPFSLVLSSANAPRLAWASGSAGSGGSGGGAGGSAGSAFYTAWNGSAWAGVSQSDTAGIAAASCTPGLALDGNDAPYLAWTQQGQGAGESSLVLYSYAAGAWSALTSQLFDNTSAQPSVSLAETRQGTSIVTWQGDSGGSTNSINLLQFGLGNVSNNVLSDNGSSVQSSTILLGSQGQVIVGWADGKAQVGSLQVDTLTAFGASTAVSNQSSAVSEPVGLALLSDGSPVVAWQDAHSGTASIYLLQWNGSLWEELAGSNTGTGLSGGAQAHHPTLAVDAGNHLFVGWEDTSSQQIYVRVWDGTKWEAFATQAGNSASGTGISSAGTAALWPRLRITSKGQAVLGWYEGGSTVRVCAVTAR